MGAWVSDNFDDVNPVLEFGIWSVHSATKKSTGEPVYIWTLNVPQNADQNHLDKFTKNCISGLQQQRKLMHPQILRIYDINEESKPLSFTTEPFQCLVSQYSDYTQDEIFYIAKQTADVMEFLHDNAKVSHLSINSESLVLISNFNIKLTNFTFASPIAEDSKSKIMPKYGNWANNMFYPALCTSAPEVVMNKDVFSSSDSFSFGVLITSLLLHRPLISATTTSEYLGSGKSAPGQIPIGLDDEARQLLRRCLSGNPKNRPEFSEIRTSPAFMTIQTQALLYIDNIITKTPSDRYTFFKGLFTILSTFSQRIRTQKILPFLIEQLKEEKRFGPALVPLIIQSAQGYEKFLDIFQFIQPYLLINNPPEMCLAALSCIQTLVNELPRTKHYNSIYPIISNALEGTDYRLHVEAIKKMHLIIDTLSESEIESSVLPKLISLLQNSSEETATSVVRCMVLIIDKCDNITIARTALPRIQSAFIRSPNEQMATEISNLVSKIDVTAATALRFVVPLASTTLAEDCAETVKKPLAIAIQKAVNSVVPLSQIDTDDTESKNQKPESESESYDDEPINKVLQAKRANRPLILKRPTRK